MVDTQNIYDMLGHHHNDYLDINKRSKPHSRQPIVQTNYTQHSLDPTPPVSSNPYSPQAIMSFRPRHSEDGGSDFKY